MISGFALWADGFKNIPIMDLVFGIILAAATCLYPYGNAVDVVSKISKIYHFVSIIGWNIAHD